MDTHEAPQGSIQLSVQEALEFTAFQSRLDGYVEGVQAAVEHVRNLILTQLAAQTNRVTDAKE